MALWHYGAMAGSVPWHIKPGNQAIEIYPVWSACIIRLFHKQASFFRVCNTKKKVLSVAAPKDVGIVAAFEMH